MHRQRVASVPGGESGRGSTVWKTWRAQPATPSMPDVAAGGLWSGALGWRRPDVRLQRSGASPFSLSNAGAAGCSNQRGEALQASSASQEASAVASAGGVQDNRSCCAPWDMASTRQRFGDEWHGQGKLGWSTSTLHEQSSQPRHCFAESCTDMHVSGSPVCCGISSQHGQPHPYIARTAGICCHAGAT